MMQRLVCVVEGHGEVKAVPVLLRRPHRPVRLVLAQREFEGWFLAGVESLRAKRGLPANLPVPQVPESIRGAKEWLRDRMPTGYDAVVDQAPFCHHLDLQLTRRRSTSFDKLCRDVESLLSSL